jgi:predicted ArsR family transcriptional regulator
MSITGNELRTRRRVRLLSHPVRSAIVESLTIETASAAELAEQLGVAVETVRSHLRKLMGVGLVERVEKTRRRGVPEFLYRATAPHQVIHGRGSSGSIPSHRTGEATLRSLRLMLREARAAIQAGTFTERDEVVASRFPFPVDARALQEAYEIHAGLMEQTVAAADRGKARVDAGGEGILAEAAVLFFEMPISPWPTPLSPDAVRRGQWERTSNRSAIDRIAGTIQVLRLKVLDFLSLRPATAAEIAHALRVPAEEVRYELKQLQQGGFVETHAERSRRGVRERVFIARSRNTIFYPDDVTVYEGHRLATFHESLVSRIFGDAVDALRAGAFGMGENALLARVLTWLDHRGFAEIEARHADAVHELMDLREACLRRIEEAETEPRVAYSGLLLFERAPHSPPAD